MRTVCECTLGTYGAPVSFDPVGTGRPTTSLRRDSGLTATFRVVETTSDHVDAFRASVLFTGAARPRTLPTNTGHQEEA